MADILLSGVTKRFPGSALAVNAFDLHIQDGEFVILVGPSGCGKSTVLNMIAGLEEITSGELRIGGKVVTNTPPSQRDIAMVFQSYALYPHLSVRENMAFPLKLKRLDPGVIAQKVREAAEILELSQLLERKPSQLSGGQRQRVAMGRAIVRSPKAFLMDEPLSNLDAKLRVQMRTQIARLQKRLGTTTVYVTHDQTEAMTLGHRVVVMRRGVVQQVASPQALYQRPANLFVASFIGSPPMNFFSARLEENCLRGDLGDIPLPDSLHTQLALPRGGRDVIVGIRPEHLADAGLAGESAPGHVVESTVQVLESIGSDVYAYFRVGRAEGGGGPQLRATLEAAELEPSSDLNLVARLHPDTAAREGAPLRLWIDPEKLALFDPENGTNLRSACV